MHAAYPLPCPDQCAMLTLNVRLPDAARFLQTLKIVLRIISLCYLHFYMGTLLHPHKCESEAHSCDNTILLPCTLVSLLSTQVSSWISVKPCKSAVVM